MTTFQFPARLPADVKEWLHQQSSLHGSSMNSEIIRALRERMHRIERDTAQTAGQGANHRLDFSAAQQVGA